MTTTENNAQPRCALGLFLILIALSPSATFAGPTSTQTSRPTTDAASIEATPDAINAQVKRVEANPDIKDADKTELLKIYQQALVQAQEAAEWVAKGDDFEKQRHVAPVLITDAKQQLAETLAPRVPNVPADATLAQLEQKLNQAQADAAAARKKLRDFDADSAPQPKRRTEIPKQIAELKQRIEHIKTLQKAPSPANETMEFRVARRTLLRAQRRAAQDQADALDNELLSLNVRIDLHAVQRQLAERDVAAADKYLALWRNIVNGRRKSEAELAAREAREKAAQTIPEVRSLALENAALAEERTGPNAPAAKIDDLNRILQNLQKRLDKITVRFEGTDKVKGIKTKVEQAGINHATSILLRKERAAMPDARKVALRLKNRQNELEQVQTRINQLQEDLDWYAESEARLAEVMAQMKPGMDPLHRIAVEDAVKEQLKLACDYRQALLNDYNSYFDALFTLSTTGDELFRKTAEVARYIDEHVFWFPSTGSLFSAAVLPAAKKACEWFIDPDKEGSDGWGQVFRVLAADAKSHLPLYALVLVAFFPSLVLVRRVKRRFTDPALAQTAKERDSFALTVKMLIQTLLTAAVWPGLLFFLVWRFSVTPDTSDFTKAVVSGLFSVAVVLVTLQIFTKLCLPGGVAERHFRWNAANIQVIRNNLYWLHVVSLPLIFIVDALEFEQNEDARASLGRIAFILLFLAFSLFMQRVLGPLRHALQRNISAHWEGWGTWTHYVWYPVAIGIPAALAVLAAVGYYYTADQLAWRMLATLWILLAVLIIREMFLRWISLTRLSIARKRAEEIHNAQDASAQPQDASSPDDQPEPPDQSLSVYTISIQTRKVVDAFVIVALALALWSVWDDVLPALAFLKEIHPWGFTLTDLLLAVVIAFMTYVAGRNIPGLLEMTLLDHLPLDSGLRFAVTKVTRYVIVILGTVVTFKTLGYNWSDIQWLIAAMTVGLSFGLQEIFANFISGLIILFERPMRVGDIVTVGSISGKVTRIQIRATTIIDGENKELIVPNREFITGRVVNWTLSDRVLRLPIDFAIAYGSDTDLAQRLLVKIAKANPNVLPSPAPAAVFVGFGEHGMKFELGVFTTIENYGTVRHELNTAINRAFREAGIQIPIPQQEIHVRAIRELLTGQDLKFEAAQQHWPKIPDTPDKLDKP